MISNHITDLVGNTPLIKLKKASEITGCNILGKAEFLNPGQSIKDRAALKIIQSIDKKNYNSNTLVEGTGGNTGIGLTILGNSLGFKSVIVLPENQSKEKINMLKYLGAEVIITEQVPYENPKNFPI